MGSEMCIRDRFWVSSKDPLAKEEAVVGNKARGLALLEESGVSIPCLLYTSDAADERSSVDLGGRRII